MTLSRQGTKIFVATVILSRSVILSVSEGSFLTSSF